MPQQIPSTSYTAHNSQSFSHLSSDTK